MRLRRRSPLLRVGYGGGGLSGVMPRGSAALYKGTQPIRVVTLNEPWAQRQLVLCVRSEESLSSVARLLVDHLRAG